jgi:hypothetical protein
MKTKPSIIVAAAIAGAAALVAAQEPGRAPTANPMPQPTAAPAPTAARGTEPTPGGGYAGKRRTPIAERQITPAPTPGR